MDWSPIQVYQSYQFGMDGQPALYVDRIPVAWVQLITPKDPGSPEYGRVLVRFAVMEGEHREQRFEANFPGRPEDIGFDSLAYWVRRTLGMVTAVGDVPQPDAVAEDRT